MIENNFISLYEKLLISPDNADKEFIIAGKTYKEVYDLASGIAELCRKTNVNTLCLCTENKAVIIASLLASINCGPSVLLPHSFDKRTIREMKSAAGFDLVLSDKPEEMPLQLEVVTPDQVGLKGKPLSQLRDPDSVFLKLFTGGSTGKSKIWQKTPRNIFSEALYHSKAFKVLEKDIFISTVPPQHIYGLLYSVIVPFISSAKVIGQTCAFPQEIISSIKVNSGTILVSIPVHYRVLKSSSLNFPSLRLALSSAGSLEYADAEYFFKETGIAIAEIFGSTETGGIAIRYNSGQEKALMPFKNIDWKIQDGKLSVQSDFISPELPRDAEGYYITEDRVENAGENNFMHLGRADGIVKVAGKRVDLKEVENKLKQIIGVADAVVIALPVSGGRKNVIAAIIEGCLDHKTVKKRAKELLEPYALPRKIKILEKLPVTAAGKYDRQKIMSFFKL